MFHTIEKQSTDAHSIVISLANFFFH